MTLDGSLSSGCTAYKYQWLEGTTPLCGGWSTTATCDVSPSTTTTYTLEVICEPRPECVVRMDAVVEVIPDVAPGELINTLRAVRAAGDVVLSWGLDANAITYVVYRGDVKGQWPPPPLLSGLTTTTAAIPDVLSSTTLYFYRTAGVSCSGVEGP